MGLFISEAWAAGEAGGAAGQAGGLFSNPIVFLILFFAIFYFILIRPQQKKQKEHRALVSGLAKGDEIITSGGLVGRVTAVSDNYITMEIADGVEMKLQRSAVQTVLPKGTIKTL